MFWNDQKIMNMTKITGLCLAFLTVWSSLTLKKGSGKHKSCSKIPKWKTYCPHLYLTNLCCMYASSVLNLVEVDLKFKYLVSLWILGCKTCVPSPLLTESILEVWCVIVSIFNVGRPKRFIVVMIEGRVKYQQSHISETWYHSNKGIMTHFLGSLS